MLRPRPLAVALTLALGSCLEVNPGYLGPTTSSSGEASTGASTTETTTAASSTGSTGTAMTGLSDGGSGGGSGVPAGCGDGIVDVGEACDDGQNGDQDDGCTDFCALPTCGDDFLQPNIGEECDEGATNGDQGACTGQCKAAICGDGLVRVGYEDCDDGNQVDEDGCQTNCTKLAVVKMVMSDSTTCALLSHGKIRCWGYNIVGQLGLGDTVDRGSGPGELPTPYVALGDLAIDLATGGTSTCSVSLNGVVRCWGGNMFGELGLGVSGAVGDEPGELPPKLVEAGEAILSLTGGSSGFFCGLGYGGAAHCWGRNLFGQLGLSDTNDRGDGPFEMPVAAVPTPDALLAVAAGGSHVCARLTDDGVTCWGYGELGQLGYENGDSLGDNAEELPAGPVTVDAVDADVVQLAAGDLHTCARRGSQGVRCWGSGAMGQLGTGDVQNIGNFQGSMPPADIDLGGPALQIVAGANHNCALLDDGTVRCWGNNASGQLGIGSTENIGDDPGEMPPSAVPLGGTPTTIFAGGNHTCALLVDGTVRCWGDNLHGQLGIGSTENIGDDETPDTAPLTPVTP